MDAEFSFPCSFKDLAVNRNEEFYVEVLSDKDIILSKFQEYRDSYDTNLLENFVSNFNVFYSAIEHFSKFDRADLIEIWHSLVLVNSNVYHEIVNLLDDFAECSVYSKQSLRNIFSMNMFLLIHLALEFENDEPQKRAKVQLSEEMKNGGKGKRAVQNDDLWKDENQTFLELCCRILSLDLKKLWAPALVDERLIDGIGEFCQKMLHPWNASRKQSLLKAFDLLIHTYNHGITFAVQLIQSLAAADTTPEKIAEMVSNLANNDSETFLVEILKELSQVDAAALSNEGVSAKNYSVFLVEVARLIPDCLLRNISLLVPFLTEDSFAFRNGVLTAFSILISKKLTGEDLPESLVTLRTQFFKHLLEHIHDVNGLVRGKALQLFTKLVLEKCVPLNEYKLLMPLAIGRLADKLPTVRKAAIQLLSNILNNNPFMKKVTIEELQNRLETEKKNLENLVHSSLTRFKGNKESEAQDSVNEKWAVARNRMSDILDELIEKYWEDGSLNLPDELCNFEEASDIISKSALDCIVSGDYRETILRFVHFGKLHPDSALLASVFDTHCTSAEFKRNLLDAIKFVFCDLIMASVIIDGPLVEEIREKVMQGDQVQRQKIVIRFIEDSLCFLQQVHSILPLITEMLYQNQLSDVLESIDFLVNCVSHGVSSNNETIWKCFELVWSTQEAVRNGALKAFQKLCIDINSEFNESYIIEMRIQRLLVIMQKANDSQYFTLAKLISLAVKKGILENFNLMPAWDIIQNNKDTLEKKKIALKIICMFAANDKNVLRGNIKRLVVFGLSENSDFHTTYLVLRTLSQLGCFDRQSNLKFLEEIACEVEECSLFCRVMRFLLDGVTNYDDLCWIAAMEYGIRLIFYAAPNPDVICASFLKSLSAKNEEESKKEQHYPLFLTRLLSALGQVAYCSFHFLDMSFLNQLKKSRNTNEQVNNNEKKAVDSVFGLDTVASLEDRDRDFVNKICEEYILKDGTFLGEYSKVVIKICKQPIKYNYAPLQAAAAETLMKLMFISQKFCAENCRLLVTMLEKSKFPVVRRTIMTLLPDLYARHPNEIEYWTKRIHSRIFDENLSVRVCSISIMSYLVLHNLTKPGRMLADIAICTVDENATIVALAKRFFKEYSDKTTTFFSILPDISGQLSLKYNEIGAEKSLEICKFLYSFINKERQNESFVDRLCERFVIAKNIEHCHILAKCLTLPAYNERLIRKVVENMKCYEDKLKDDTVLKCFLSVVDSAKRNWKSDGKERLDMLQAEFKEKHEKYKATEMHFAPDHSVLNAEEPVVVEASSDPTENVGQAYVNKLRLSLHHQMESAEWSFLRTICPDLDETIADMDLNGKDETDTQLKTAIEDCENAADKQESSDELVKNNDKTNDDDGHLSVTTDLNSAKTKAPASGKRTPGRPRKRMAIDDDSSSVSKRTDDDDDQRRDSSSGKEITSQSVLRTDNNKEKKSSLEKRKAMKNASKKSQAAAADRVVNLTESSDDEPAMKKSNKTSMKTDRRSIDTEKSNVTKQQSTSTPKDSTLKKGKYRRYFIQDLSSESDDAKEDNFFAYLTKFNIKTPLGSSKVSEVSDGNTAERRAEKKNKKKKKKKEEEEEEKKKMKGSLLSSDDDDSNCNFEETPVTTSKANNKIKKSSILMKRQKGKKEEASSESEEEEEVSMMRTRLSTLRSRQLKADRSKKEKRKLKAAKNVSAMQIDSSSSDREDELSNNYKLRSGTTQRGKKLGDSKVESRETTKSSSFLRPNIMNWDDITNSMNRSTRSRRESSGNISSDSGNSRSSSNSSSSSSNSSSDNDDDDDDGKIKMLNTTTSQRRNILKNFRKARQGGHVSRKTLFEMSQRSSSAFVKNSSDDEQQQSSGVFSEKKKRSVELRNAKRKLNTKAVEEEEEEEEDESIKSKNKKTEKNTGRGGGSGKLKNTAASTKSENKNDSRKRKADFNLFESDNEDESVDSVSEKSKFKNTSSYATGSRRVSFRKNVKAKSSSEEEEEEEEEGDDDGGNTSSDVVEPKKKVYKKSELPSSSSSSSKAKQSKKISGQQQMKKSNTNNTKQKNDDAEVSTSLTYSLRSGRKLNYKL